jgi:hypothetical protein
MNDNDWTPDTTGPSCDEFTRPERLTLPREMQKPPAAGVAGVYLITAGRCLAHVGFSGELRGRIGNLTRLSYHGGSAEVLCAAYCTKVYPMVRWYSTGDDKQAANTLEAEFKKHYGEPPWPCEFQCCKNGERLREALVQAAGENSWEAGYIEAVFDIGDHLGRLFKDARFTGIWQQVGIPPGPWEKLASKKPRSKSKS